MELVEILSQRHPDLRFSKGTEFCWSPETKEISYKENLRQAGSLYSLLHETGHALLNHQTYRNDVELLEMEVQAWEKAKELATEVGMVIEEDHIQDCLDTYREWVYKRSICPKCATKSLQQGNTPYYRCFNCHMVWKVSDSRFCRAYRTTKNIKYPSAIPRPN
jgi:hypothetical protein